MLGTRLHRIANTPFPWPSFKSLKAILCSPTTSEEDFRISDSIKEEEEEISVKTPTAVKFIIGNGDESAENEDPSSSLEDEQSATRSAQVVPDSTSKNNINDRRRSSIASSGESTGESTGSLLSPTHTVDMSSEGLRRSSSTIFLEANPYRKYVEKCMHSKGLKKTFDKIVEVIRDVMARTVCVMDEEDEHHHNKSVTVLEEHCCELQRQLYQNSYTSDMFLGAGGR